LVNDQASRSYSPGEKLTIGIELRDQSGVEEVIGHFSNRATNDLMRLRANGRGERQVMVQLEKEISENDPPGPWACSYIEIRDVNGRYTIHTPDPNIRFVVERSGEDLRGPLFMGWHFIDS